MDKKKLEEANKKFEKLKKAKKDKKSEEKTAREGMAGKDLRKNLGCG